MEKISRLLKIILIACYSMFSFVDNSSAQETWEEIIEQLVVNDENDSYSYENVMEELAELKSNPIPINSATKEQLESIPFLSSELVENILYYLYKYGPMISEKELMMVENMDQQTMRFLLPLITFQTTDKEKNTISLKNIGKYGKHELSVRMDVPFYTKEGYRDKYLGDKLYHNFRYSFKYGNHIYMGITAEKDAGECFFQGNNKKGYDYYSPYLLIQNIGKINSLAIGNYRLNYGYGLVMNTNFGLGKTSMLATLGNSSKGIRKHSSTDEYNYLQGIAGSFSLSKRWTIDAFYSYRKMSGTIKNLFITSLKKDGYFRTQTDLEKRNTFSNQLIGSNLNYNGKHFEFGLTTVYNVFNRVLNPDIRYYNTYYPRGDYFFNTGINYKLFWKQFTLWGETAIDKNGKIATLNVLRYSPKSNTQIMVMNRFYDAAYQSMYARSIGEGSMVQNESGFYIGLETSLLRHFKLNAYIDRFYFPWKKYLVSKVGTTGWDSLLQLSYSPTYKLNMLIRYRYKNKYKDYTDDSDVKHTLPYIQQKWRYQLNYSPTDEWQLKTTLDYVNNRYRNEKSSQGILVAQSFSFPFNRLPLKIDGNIAWFCTDDYSSRISFYEKGLLYMFSVPSFYGRGIRFSLLGRYQLNEHWVFQVKYGLTRYSDRDAIGSSLEQINGNVKSDLYLQMRVKF